MLLVVFMSWLMMDLELGIRSASIGQSGGTLESKTFVNLNFYFKLNIGGHLSYKGWGVVGVAESF